MFPAARSIHEVSGHSESAGSANSGSVSTQTASRNQRPPAQKNPQFPQKGVPIMADASFLLFKQVCLEDSNAQRHQGFQKFDDFWCR